MLAQTLNEMDDEVTEIEQMLGQLSVEQLDSLADSIDSQSLF